MLPCLMLGLMVSDTLGLSVPLGRGAAAFCGLERGSDEGKGKGGGGFSVVHRVLVLSWWGTPVWLSTHTSMGDELKRFIVTLVIAILYQDAMCSTFQYSYLLR